MNHDWMEQTMVYELALLKGNSVDINFENERYFIAKEMVDASVVRRYK